MHVHWSRQQLKSNRQVGEVLCPHEDVKRPWIISPTLVHQINGRSVSVWSPGPSIRECCTERAFVASLNGQRRGLAVAAWWWEVKHRFKDLEVFGLPEQPDIARALLEQADLVESYLEDRVPKPTVADWKQYELYREDLGLTRRRIRQVPPCFKKLGLKWPCSEEELNKRWKEIALKSHPDRGGTVQEFHAYCTAYNAAKRVFDRLQV